MIGTKVRGITYIFISFGMLDVHSFILMHIVHLRVLSRHLPELILIRGFFWYSHVHLILHVFMCLHRRDCLLWRPERRMLLVDRGHLLRWLLDDWVLLLVHSVVWQREAELIALSIAGTLAGMCVHLGSGHLALLLRHFPHMFVWATVPLGDSLERL